MTGNQEQKNIRKKLRQTDEAEIQRPPRDLVNLPSHGNRQHLQGSNNGEALYFVQRKVSVMECSQPGSQRTLGFSHALLMCHKQPSETSAMVHRLECVGGSTLALSFTEC